MSTPLKSTNPLPAGDRRTRLVPALCVAIGVVYLIVGLIAGQPLFAVAGLLIMLGYAAFLLFFGRRSESVGLLGGDVSDERRALITLKASALTGNVLTVVLLVGFIVSLALGASTLAVFTALTALAGVLFIAGTIWFSQRT